jgi:stage II sporulation protein AA (anti-sigma F factor antagonist)
MGVKKITARSETLEDAFILYLNGEISSTSLEDFKGVIKAALENRHRHLVLSMKEISYIDSAGIGGIMGALLSVKRIGGDLKIAEPGKFVMNLFKILQIEKIIPIYSDVKEALSDG